METLIWRHCRQYLSGQVCVKDDSNRMTKLGTCIQEIEIVLAVNMKTHFESVLQSPQEICSFQGLLGFGKMKGGLIRRR